MVLRLCFQSLHLGMKTLQTDCATLAAGKKKLLQSDHTDKNETVALLMARQNAKLMLGIRIAARILQNRVGISGRHYDGGLTDHNVCVHRNSLCFIRLCFRFLQ